MVRAVIRLAAMQVPQVRALVESRRAALQERDAALMERGAALQERDAALRTATALQEHCRDIEAALARVTADTFRSMLDACAPETWLRLMLNDADLWLPRDTLRTMVHCAFRRPDGRLLLHVEEAHLRWMMERLAEGGTFLDVGCATGATTLPVAVILGGRVRIISYEPATAARNLLTATLERNRIEGVELRPVAVADRPGTAEFREFQPDETGEIPFLPETSTLVGTIIADRPHLSLQVPVVTLDDDALPRCGADPVVVKIDVEGFETFVLRGAAALIAARRPWFCIDIHSDPFGDGTVTTESAVRDFLAERDYRFETMGHVLLCSPLG